MASPEDAAAAAETIHTELKKINEYLSIEVRAQEGCVGVTSVRLHTF